MEKLYSRIQQDCPNIGLPLLDELGTVISHIIYADDVVLMARSEQELQRLLDALQAFCREVGLSVNNSKSVVMVFGSQGSSQLPTPSLTIANEVLQQVECFKYLGVHFHSTKWLREASSTLSAACH